MACESHALECFYILYESKLQTARHWQKSCVNLINKVLIIAVKPSRGWLKKELAIQIISKTKIVLLNHDIILVQVHSINISTDGLRPVAVQHM